MPKSEMATQQDIQNMLDVWRMGCQNDVKEEYENCKKCPSRKICKQAYNQLVSIVKQHFQQQPVKMTRGDVFVDHILEHLKPGQRVICKICGKDVDLIYREFKESGKIQPED